MDYNASAYDGDECEIQPTTHTPGAHHPGYVSPSRLPLRFGQLAVFEFVCRYGPDYGQKRFVEVPDKREMVANHIDAKSQNRINDVEVGYDGHEYKNDQQNGVCVFHCLFLSVYVACMHSITEAVNYVELETRLFDFYSRLAYKHPSRRIIQPIANECYQ